MAPPAHIPIIQESQKDRALGLLPSAVGRIGQVPGLLPQVRTVNFRTPGRNMPDDDAGAGRWAGSAEQDRWADSRVRASGPEGRLSRTGPVGRIGEAGSCQSVPRADGPAEPARRATCGGGSVGLKGAE